MQRVKSGRSYWKIIIMSIAVLCIFSFSCARRIKLVVPKDCQHWVDENEELRDEIKQWMNKYELLMEEVR